MAVLGREELDEDTSAPNVRVAEAAEVASAISRALAEQWSVADGFTLPAPSDEVAVQILGLVLGAAFQHRLDPAVVPEDVVVPGLRRLLGITGSPADQGPQVPRERT